jgi:hypothetical protein
MGLHLLQRLYMLQDYVLLLASPYGIGCLCWHALNLTTLLRPPPRFLYFLAKKPLIPCSGNQGRFFY